MPTQDRGGQAGQSLPPHAAGSAPIPSSFSPVGWGGGGIWLGPQAALGLQGLKGSLQRWGEVGVTGGSLDIKQLLRNFQKLPGEFSANECAADNEVPSETPGQEK